MLLLLKSWCSVPDLRDAHVVPRHESEKECNKASQWQITVFKHPGTDICVFCFQAFLVMSRNRTCRFFWLGQELPPKKQTQKNTRQSFLVAFRSVKLRKACRNIICAWMHGSMQMIHLLPTTSWKLRSILPSTYPPCCPTWQPQRMAVLQDAFVRNAPFQLVSGRTFSTSNFFGRKLLVIFFVWGEVDSRKVQTVNSCGVYRFTFVGLQVYICNFQGLCFFIHPGRLFFANWTSMSDFMWFSRKTGMITPLSRDDTHNLCSEKLLNHVGYVPATCYVLESAFWGNFISNTSKISQVEIYISTQKKRQLIYCSQNISQELI